MNEDGVTDGPQESLDDGPRYKVKIEGQGLNVDQEISQPVALGIISLIMGGAPDTTSARRFQGATSPRTSNNTDISVGEYLLEQNARRNSEKITAIAWYLYKYRGQETFTKEDIKKEFRNARESMPANYPRDFDTAISNKWIAGGANDFHVTTTGETAVENKFSNTTRKKASPVARRKKTSKSKSDKASTQDA